MDREGQQRIIGGLENLGSIEPKTLEEHKKEFKDLSAIDQLITKKAPLGKREAKRLEKEKKMVYMKYVQHMKPRDIAKQMRVPVEDVYMADQRLKINYGKSMNTA